MRKLRILAADAWYHVSTAVNNREPLFWDERERARFEQVLCEAREIYVFELRGLQFEGPWVSFYIKPADGFELPVIMQWVKQTYAVRYNVYDGRTGHIWGDRYWSKILPGEPPGDAEEYVFLPVVRGEGRGRRKRGAADKGGGGWERGGPPGSPMRDAEGRPRTGRRAVKPPQRPGSPRDPAGPRG
jgi:REP element-mobilizing transposase RayT